MDRSRDGATDDKMKRELTINKTTTVGLRRPPIFRLESSDFEGDSPFPAYTRSVRALESHSFKDDYDTPTSGISSCSSISSVFDLYTHDARSSAEFNTCRNHNGKECATLSPVSDFKVKIKDIDFAVRKNFAVQDPTLRLPKKFRSANKGSLTPKLTLITSEPASLSLPKYPDPYRLWKCAFGFDDQLDHKKDQAVSALASPKTKAEFVELLNQNIESMVCLQRGLLSYLRGISSGKHQDFEDSFLEQETEATHMTIGQLYHITANLKDASEKVAKADVHNHSVFSGQPRPAVSGRQDAHRIGGGRDDEKPSMTTQSSFPHNNVPVSKAKNIEAITAGDAVNGAADAAQPLDLELESHLKHALPWINRARAILLSNHVFYKINFVLAGDKTQGVD